MENKKYLTRKINFVQKLTNLNEIVKFNAFNHIQHRILYALYDIGWGPFGPHCINFSKTIQHFATKIGTQIKLAVFFQIVK